MNTVFACRIHGKLVCLVCSCSLGEGGFSVYFPRKQTSRTTGNQSHVLQGRVSNGEKTIFNRIVPESIRSSVKNTQKESVIQCQC